jgi:hypothetical protein
MAVELNLEWLLEIKSPDGQIFSGKVDAGKEEETGPYVLKGLENCLLATLDCNFSGARDLICKIVRPANWENKTEADATNPITLVVTIDKSWKTGQEAKFNIKNPKTGKFMKGWNITIKKISPLINKRHTTRYQF